jgi:putative aminopeptidase FrvX
MKGHNVPSFLLELLHARSPSGYEFEAQKVFDDHVERFADAYAKDPLGNRLATCNPQGDPVLMFAGHMDELGLNRACPKFAMPYWLGSSGKR